MATSTGVCDICDLQHLNNPSTDWCPECEEALCSSCKQHHSLSKATRGHKTIPIGDYQKLPPFISEIKQHCSEHSNTYQLFCQTHDRPLCNKCIKEHAKCSDIIPLEEVLENAKTSNALQDLEQNLVDLIGNIQGMKKDRQENLTEVKGQKTKWLEEVNNLRRQINQHLDKLEQQIIKELDDAERTATVNVQEILKSLEEKEKEVSENQAVIRNIQRYASDLQTFLGMKEIETKVVENEKVLQSLVNNKSLDQYSVECTINTKIKDIVTNVHDFGSVQLKASPSRFSFTTRKDKQAQIFLDLRKGNFDDLSLKLIRKINTKSSIGGSFWTVVRGCCMISEDEILFTDHAGDKLIALNKDVSKKYELELKYAFDIAHIDDQTVAISSGDMESDKGVRFFDLTRRKIIKFIDLPGYTYGISRHGGSLICCVEEKGFYFLNINDLTITSVIPCNVSSYSYVSIHDNKLYYTDPKENKVKCCDYSGTIIWEFMDSKIIYTPRGVTIDNHGNIYVACESSNNVIIISPDGKTCKQLLTKEDGLMKPVALSIDSSKNQLLVANLQNTLFLYSTL